MKIIKKICLPLLALLPLSATALDSDKTRPLKVQADKASLHKTTGISIYTGNVIIKQGSLEIRADQLKVYTSSGRLQKMIAYGTPATFQQRPEHKKQDITAKARKMTFNAIKNITVFEKKAELRQGKNTFKSNHIIYNMKTDTVIAGKQNGGDRVTITIQPGNPSE